MVDSPIPHSILEASGVVGTWVHDHRTGLLSLTGSVPALLGLDPVAAAGGITLETFLDTIEPDDRIRIENYLFTAATTGGPVEAEFRSCGSEAGIRTLVMRGRIDRDPTGRTLQGRGIVIDRTEEQVRLLSRSEQVVNRMAELAIILRSLAQILQRPSLMDRIDGLMMEIGYELARHLPELKSEDDLRH